MRILHSGDYDDNALQNFAIWFNQDYQDWFDDFLEGGAIYLRGRTARENEVLATALESFVSSMRGSDAEVIMGAWWGLGASAWDPTLPLLETLSKYAVMARSGAYNYETSE